MSARGKTRIGAVIAGAMALGLVLVAAPGRAAGSGGAPQAGQVREEVTVALKLLQAYVTTKDGKPVTDLTAADFEVTDNGKVVPVTHFESHILGGDSLAPGAAVGAARLERQFFLFFDFAFTDFRSSRKARDAALAFIDQNVKPSDLIGVLSYSPARGLTIHEYLTRDHLRVRSIVEALRGEGRLPSFRAVGVFVNEEANAMRDIIGYAGLDAAQIEPETVLVKLLLCFKVPETAGIGAYFITEQYAVVIAAEFKFEIHKHEFPCGKKLPQNGIDRNCAIFQHIELLVCCHAKSDGMGFVHERIVEVVVFQVKFHYRLTEHGSFAETVSFNQ
jgi:hypothetical protein